MILKDSRWDMKFLGMQIMVEGLALAAFAMIRNNTQEPLLKELTSYVMGDEARHVAFGILSLRDYYREQPESVRREREDFVYEAARLMRDRFLFQEVWEKTGLPAKQCMDIALNNQGQVMFRQMLFAKIVPAIKKMDLLSDRQRQRFAELGILQFENWADPVADHRAEPDRRDLGSPVSERAGRAMRARMAPLVAARSSCSRSARACKKEAKPAPARRRRSRRAPSAPTASATIAIEAGTEGYMPDRIPGKPGEKLVLVFTRTVDATCIAQLDDARQASSSICRWARRSRSR